MYEIMMYVGIGMTSFFFVMAVVIFVKEHIPAVVGYLVKKDRKVVVKKYIQPKPKPQRVKAPVVEEATEVLDMAQNYAEVLLDAEATEVLPDIGEEIQ